MSNITRKSTERFLIGQINDHCPKEQLATRRDVLKYLFFKKFKAKNDNNKKNPPLNSLVCCPQKRESRQAKCNEDGGCTPEDMCVVSADKEAWGKAGYSTVSDVTIR